MAKKKAGAPETPKEATVPVQTVAEQIAERKRIQRILFNKKYRIGAKHDD